LAVEKYKQVDLINLRLRISELYEYRLDTWLKFKGNNYMEVAPDAGLKSTAISIKINILAKLYPLKYP